MSSPVGGDRPSVGELLTPRGVAIVGVSPAEEYAYARLVVLALKEGGFPAIYPVNPKYREYEGLPCYPSLRAITGPVDYVVVSIPAESTPALLDDCAAKGVKCVHFFTAGFSESGRRGGVELERVLLEKARAGGFRIIGPNCTGVVVAKGCLVTMRGIPVERGPVAFLSQSGGNAQNLPFFGSTRGLRFSAVVSYGNGLDVDDAELLEYFSRDPETEIIGAYIEGVKKGPRFVRALREAAGGKPVVIHKGGQTEAGRRAAFSHTASLAGSAAIFQAMCRQLRVIQVDDFDELIDVLVGLRFARPLPRGRGIAVVGTGGGPAVLASDEMEKAGLRLPALPAEVREKLGEFLPAAGSIYGNPVDATNLLNPQVILATMRVLAQAPEIHTLIYHMGFHPTSRWRDGRFSAASFLQPAIDALEEVRRTSGKPILLALRPAPDPGGVKDFLTVQEAFVKAGFPVFHSLGQAGKAVSRIAAWAGV